MYEYLNREQRRAVCSVLAALIRSSLVWLVALPLGFAALLGVLATVVGLQPVDSALQFLGEAAVDLSGLVFSLWTGCFLVASLCFGVGRNLPELLQHCSLSAGIIARFVQTFAIRTPSWSDGAIFFASQHCWQTVLTRPSRTALCTATDLAGSTPRLE